jgi:hypothetical protein
MGSWVGDACAFNDGKWGLETGNLGKVATRHLSLTSGRAFLKEADPTKRFKWVRKAEEVKARLAEYPEEARAGLGERPVEETWEVRE